jgi:hypothetical protein
LVAPALTGCPFGNIGIAGIAATFKVVFNAFDP